MANVLLGVTGSVAALKTPLLFQALTQAGHEVKVVATDAALYFFNKSELPAGSVHVDADEWPRREMNELYHRDDPILHIELRRWADLYLIAPLDANSLAKLAMGFCDNCLTCAWRAWDTSKAVLIAPAMNTSMWEHPSTFRHLHYLIEDHTGSPGPLDADLDMLVDWINLHSPYLHVVAPKSKRLACGDVGIGGMAEVPELVAAVNRHCLRVYGSR